MMRVLLTLLITFVGIAASFRNAFYGLLTYAFWSYTWPEKITWGLLPMGKLSFITGLILVITTIAQKKRLFSNNTKLIPVALFWLLCLLGVFTAGATEISTWQFQYFTRVITITFIMTLLIDDLKKFKYYLWSMAIFIGLIAGLSGFRGTLSGQIGSASFGFEGVIGDRNFMAVLLCAVIPIVFYLGNAESDKRLKILLRFTLIGDILALILTYARAGFLGMVTICFFIFIKAKRKLLIGLAILSTVFILFKFVVPIQYVERILTINKMDIENENVDGSVAGRLIAWRSAIEMIKANPLLGVGFYNSSEVIEQYPDPKTGTTLKDRAIHNTLLQVGAELGLLALLIYILIFFVSYRTLGKVKRRVAKYSLSHEIEHFASLLQIAFVGFFSSAFFVNAAFLDISWHLVGLTIVLEQITSIEMEEKDTNEVSVNVA